MKKLLFLILLLWAGISFAYKLKENTLTLSVPYTFTAKQQGKWNNIIKTINSSSAQIIILQWQGIGGRIDYAQEFISKLKRTGKYIIIRIIGSSLSSHAYVACAGNKLEFNTGALMFHLRAVDGYVDSSNSSKRQMRSFGSYCLQKGIINQSDIRVIENVNELWVYPDGKKQIRPDKRPQ